jgi:hypothetical protein
MYQLVSILRQATYMVSSRYHGIVTSMPSLVASAGVTMDERIRNLMRERGHNHLCVSVDDPDLGPKMLHLMESLVAEAEFIREGIGQTVVRNLKVMPAWALSLKTDAPPVPGISAWRRAFLGRIPPPAQRRSRASCGKVRSFRSRHGRIEIAVHGEFSPEHL